MIALLATVLPNVGPIDLELKLRVLKRSPRICSTFLTASGRSVLVEIWYPAPPTFLLLIFCMCASFSPTERITPAS